MDDASPTARALHALELIQDRPGISGEALGSRLGVSDRAARRYVGILREAGIPIESSPGRYGGYRLGRGFRIPPLMFSTREAFGLVMAALEGREGVSDPEDPVGRALTKILRVLPAALAEPAESLRRVSTPSYAVATDPDPEITARLVQICTAGRRIRLGYARAHGEPLTLDVDPWAVSIRRGRWYLLCWSHAQNARRVLRVDRVTSVDVLQEPTAPPPDLDPVRAIEEHLAEGWRYDVEVVIDAPVSSAVRWVPRNLGRLEPIDAGHTRLVGTTDEPDWYCRRLAAIEAPFHVVGSREIRAAALVLGDRLRDAGGLLS